MAAVRVLQALQGLKIKAVSVHTDVDADAVHATIADESVLLGATPASYGDSLKVVEAARQAGAAGVHPGSDRLPGLQVAAEAAGLQWLGQPRQVPVTLTVVEGLADAAVSGEQVLVPPVGPRCAEVVSGLDLTCSGLVADAAARGGCAVSVDLVATTLAPVTALRLPEGDDVWVDLAVAVGTEPVDPLLAVLTVWGADREAAYLRARAAWDQLVIEGPAVRRPAALGGDHL